MPPTLTSECGREAFCPECLVERASKSHLRGADQSPVADPACEQSARHAVHWHTRDVASPSQQPSVVVGVEGLDAEAFAELRRANAELAGVGSVDSAHRSHALVVEDTEASVQVLPKTPALAAVKQNGEDQGDVDLALLFRPDEPVGEEALPQRAESCRCLGQLGGHVGIAGEGLMDERAQILELVSEK